MFDWRLWSLIFGALVIFSLYSEIASVENKTACRCDVESQQTIIAPPSVSESVNVASCPPPVEVERINYESVRTNDIFAAIAQPYQFRNVTTPALRLKIIEQISWTSEKWSEEIDKIFSKNINSGWVMFALVNKGMLEMTMNYLASLDLTRYKRFVIVCFDTASFTFLAELGYLDRLAMVPRSWLHVNVSSEFVGWSQKTYLDLLQAKLLIIMELWRRGHSLFYNDVDFVFLSPFVVDYLNLEDRDINADVWYMIDGMEDVMSTYLFLCSLSSANPVQNTDGGFWFGRPSNQTIELYARAFNYTLIRKDLKVDQHAINYVLRNDMKSYFFSEKVRPLSKVLFPCGLVARKRNANQNLQLAPMVVHANWIIGNAKKKTYFQSKNMWYVGNVFANSSVSLMMDA